MNIAHFDLNLLKVFVAVDEYRHVTRAANAIGLTQPALSHALNRLREALGDSLFVKTTKGMVPTPRAEALRIPAREVLEKIHRELLGGKTFEPRALERTFRLRTTDMVEGLLFPPLLKTLEKEAPLVRVSSRSSAFSLPKEEMEKGECDLAIAGFFGDLPDGFYQQKLFSDEFLCAVREKHPRLGKKKKVSEEEYIHERHLLIAPGGELQGRVDKKLKRFVAAGVGSFHVSGWILGEGDMVLTAPSRLITQWREILPLHTFAPPVAVSGITVVQAWHERQHRDPAHRWLREKVSALLSRTPGPG